VAWTARLLSIAQIATDSNNPSYLAIAMQSEIGTQSSDDFKKFRRTLLHAAMVQMCARHKVRWETADIFPSAKKCVGVSRLDSYPSDEHVIMTRLCPPDHPQHGDGIPVDADSWLASVSPTLLLVRAGGKKE
jgi:hypothetical protein